MIHSFTLKQVQQKEREKIYKQIQIYCEKRFFERLGEHLCWLHQLDDLKIFSHRELFCSVLMKNYHEIENLNGEIFMLILSDYFVVNGFFLKY